MSNSRMTYPSAIRLWGSNDELSWTVVIDWCVVNSANDFPSSQVFKDHEHFLVESIELPADPDFGDFDDVEEIGEETTH